MPDYDGYLTFEDGVLSLGGEAIPGVLASSNITCDVKFDEAQSDQLSGKKKTPMGWEDAEIDFEYALLSDEDGDCYDKLAEVNALFKGYGDSAAPKILTVLNRHIQARGIDQVVFKTLASKETNKDDVIVVSLHFVEHTPPVVKAEERVVKSDQAKTASGAAPAVNPAKADDYSIPVDVG